LSQEESTGDHPASWGVRAGVFELRPQGREEADVEPLLDALSGLKQYIFCSSAGVYLKSDVLPHMEKDPGDTKSRHKGKLDTEALLSSRRVLDVHPPCLHIRIPQNQPRGGVVLSAHCRKEADSCAKHWNAGHASGPCQGLTFSYGTAGFRGEASLLPFVVFRCGIEPYLCVQSHA